MAAEALPIEPLKLFRNRGGGVSFYARISIAISTIISEGGLSYKRARLLSVLICRRVRELGSKELSICCRYDKNTFTCSTQSSCPPSLIANPFKNLTLGVDPQLANSLFALAPSPSPASSATTGPIRNGTLQPGAPEPAAPKSSATRSFVAVGFLALSAGLLVLIV